MRTTFDSEADAAHISLVPQIALGRAVRNLEVTGVDGGSVVLEFDAADVLLGVEVLSATRMLDAAFLAGAERIER